MRITILILSIFLGSLNLLGQDQIIVNDSTRIDCRIIYSSNNQIQYENHKTLSTEIVNTDTIQGYIYQGKTYYNSVGKDKLLFKPYSYHSSKNTFYGELLGSTVSYSLNYDRIIFQKRKWKNSLIIGAALLKRYEIVYPCFTMGNIFFVGQKNNHLEIGIGLTYLERVTEDSYSGVVAHTKALIFYTRIGYRYKRPEGGFFMNVGFLPLVALKVFEDDYGSNGKGSYEGIQPIGAIGFGYTLQTKKMNLKK